MTPKLKKSLGPLLGVVLFIAAVWTLHQELGNYHLEDIRDAIEKLKNSQLYLAIAFTILSYGVMSGYDLLALKYIQHQLEYRKIALTSFIGYAFSNNIGFSMIAGASVRYRLYSAWGLSSLEITKIVFMCTLTLWIGFFILGGIVLTFEPMALPQALHLPFKSARPLGFILLAIVAFYFVINIKHRKPLHLRNWEFELPSIRIFGAQAMIAITDWLLAASVLYVLLPESLGISFVHFLGFFLVAQLIGLVSQVPGGLGIFETLMLMLLSPYLSADEIVGSLLTYRLIYYLLPLASAALFFGTREVFIKKRQVQQIAQAFERWFAAILPLMLGFITFVAGAIFLFSGAIPVFDQRLFWLKQYVPLFLFEISHFLGSLIGMALILLSHGLQRRLDGAYWLTIILLVFGVLTSFTKGLHFEQILILVIVLIALVPSHRYFYRKASLLTQQFTPSWMGAIAIVAASFIWLGLFSYKHVEYSNELWWQFTFNGHAPRFLRAIAGAVVVLLFFYISRLLRPVAQIPEISSQKDLETVNSIVINSPRAEANLAFLGDKSFLFNKERSAFIMFMVEGRSWVSMGNPVGPESEWSELIWQFRELSDRYDGWPIFYQVGPNNLYHYLDLGLTLTKLGEAARVPLANFSLEGSAYKGLRHTRSKLEKEGYIFEMLPKEDVLSVIPLLKVISDSWLTQKKTREKRFSLGFFEPEYLKHFTCAVVKKDDKIIAFSNLWQAAEQEEISVDLMRYHPEIAPNGVMDYLFIQIMLWGRQQEFKWFDLGMAPMTGIENHALAPFYNRLASFVARHGEHFYNFQGLRKYKEKFNPLWQPRYLASPGGLALPKIFANLLALSSGGLKGAVIK